ncbi:unnamed protein product [Phytomonas sp. Hart1]|nr:unnamed protein product [Phytomonas sp. Hart1]|eukprot:CCW66143.1 unnamed protein product [Phytomonas sp. isolate Hart1]
MDFRRSLYEGYKLLHNKLYKAKSVSDFETTGKLTPKEFVDAGDELTQKTPVWQWVGGSENVQEYLPANKKCLVYHRASCLQRAPNGNNLIESMEEVGEDGFVLTKAALSQPVTACPDEKVITWDDDDDIGDKTDDDEVVLPPAYDNKRRVYDVYIVYDKYYETPRIYLVGYSGDHMTPLTTNQMKEDVYHSNYGKTVTIDSHPVLGIPCISIHPCRHAETMSRLIKYMKLKHEAQNKNTDKEKIFQFPVHLALFLFLKLISSVVPTIQYDISVGFDI